MERREDERSSGEHILPLRDDFCYWPTLLDILQCSHVILHILTWLKKWMRPWILFDLVLVCCTPYKQQEEEYPSFKLNTQKIILLFPTKKSLNFLVCLFWVKKKKGSLNLFPPKRNSTVGWDGSTNPFKYRNSLEHVKTCCCDIKEYEELLGATFRSHRKQAKIPLFCLLCFETAMCWLALNKNLPQPPPSLCRVPPHIRFKMDPHLNNFSLIHGQAIGCQWWRNL